MRLAALPIAALALSCGLTLGIAPRPAAAAPITRNVLRTHAPLVAVHAAHRTVRRTAHRTTHRAMNRTYHHAAHRAAHRTTHRVAALSAGHTAPRRTAHIGRAHNSDAGTAAARAEMLGLINAERAQAGADPLRLDPTLDAIAQGRSLDMIDRHYFSHHIPGGGMVFDILDRDHVSYQMAGENIALNNYITVYSLDQTVRDTNTDFMHSPDHRANILEPKYAEIGLGFAFEHGTGKLIVTEVFVQP